MVVVQVQIMFILCILLNVACETIVFISNLYAIGTQILVLLVSVIYSNVYHRS